MRFGKPGSRNKKSRVIGHIDRYSSGQLSGWAMDSENPEMPLTINVLVNGSVVAEVTADTFRQDLLEKKVGTGCHGFQVALPISLTPNEEASVTLVAKATGARVATNSFGLTREHSTRIEITHVEGDRIYGHVHGMSNADDGTQLCLFIDNAFVSGGHRAEPGEERANFTIHIPRYAYDGMPHALSVVLASEPGIGAVWIEVLPTIQTPWTYLSTSSNENGYAGLARTAGYRYESLRSNMSAHAAGQSNIAGMQNLMTAHSVVVEGFENRKKFPRLTLPRVENPMVSIVIPVHNKFYLTYHCVASIILAYNKANYEVIVIDDCSSDETVDIEEFIENAKIIKNENNLGFLLSCNKAANQARGNYIVMLNNDTEVTSYWLDELISVFGRTDNVGMVGSKLLYPDGKLQEAGGIVWSSGEPWNLGNGKNPLHPSFSYVRQADYISGAALMIDRKIWQAVGGFSEEFAPAYYEDTDLAFKVRDIGYKTFYCPFSEVIHFEGMSNGRDLSSGIKRYQVVNAPKFREKWIDAYRHNGKVGEDISINMDRGVTHRVLMLDYAIPRPDQDAGSYAAIQEVRMLQANGFKVTFVAENLAHMGKYTDELQRMGVECIYAPFFTSVHDFLQQRGKDFDLVYITRYDVADRHIENVRKYTHAKVLFNNADLHFLRELRAALSAKSKDLSGPLATRDRELALMRKVDAILSYNAVEHAVIASHNLRDDNLFICPWVVEYKGHSTSFAQRNGIAFLGGYRHQPNVEAVLYFVKEVMPSLRKVLPGVKFHVYGSSVPPIIENLACEDVIIEGYVESLDDVFENCRVFVAPLLSGAGIKGKVLDAMSYSVPSVLSPIAAEGTGVTHGSTGMIASDSQAWVNSISHLYRDESAWNALANNLEHLVRSNFSFEGGVDQMKKPLRYLGIFPSKGNRARQSSAAMT